MSDIPKVGEHRCAWFAHGFTRRCVVLLVDEQDRMAYVEFPEYDLPNEWVRWNQL